VFSTDETRYKVTVTQRNWCASCVQVGFNKKKRLVFYASLCFH